ncbi:SAGA-associated factor 73 [Physcia stellaris]|nr:SAGA-associated factor 73 [Physcia stellaris]
MASNDPSRRASMASTTSDISLLEQANGNKLAPKKEKPNGSIKLKKAIVKKSESKEGEGSEAKPGRVTRSPSPGSPIPESELGKPIEDRPDHILCKHCKKPTPRSVAPSHVKLCEQKKKDKARRKKEAKEAKAALAKERERAEKEKEKELANEAEDATGEANGADKPDDESAEPSTTQEGTIKTGKKSAGKASTDGPKQTKKRKADAEGDKEPKKKKLKKDEPPKPKLPKPKGPVDVEKQCGVALPNGGNCARSLTCKSHSMGAKRAVPGRSMPYDQLLAAYQKKNQAKQQKMALSSLAPRDEDLEPTGPINSDEETEAVMAGIARSRPQPIAQHVHFDLRRRNEIIAIKAELRANWRGQDGKGLFAQHAYPETWYRAPGLGPGGPDAGGRTRETIVREATRMAEIEASTGYNAGAVNAGHAAGVDGVGNGDADEDDAEPEPEVPEWQLKMRTAKQMLDDEDRAIADGRIKAGEAPSMARAETLSDGRQIVRVGSPGMYE